MDGPFVRRLTKTNAEGEGAEMPPFCKFGSPQPPSGRFANLQLLAK